MPPVLVSIILLIAAINCEIEYGIISPSIFKSMTALHYIKWLFLFKHFSLVNASNKYKSFLETQPYLHNKQPHVGPQPQGWK